MWLNALRLNILKFETVQSDNGILYTKTLKVLIFMHFYVLKITVQSWLLLQTVFDKVI